MPYTKDNPPILRANLGSHPYPGFNASVGSTFPHIRFVDSDGVSVAMSGGSVGEMHHVTGTPIWTFDMGAVVDISLLATTYYYYIVNGLTGEAILDEGTVEILNNNVNTEGIADGALILASAIQLPSSRSKPKTIPIKYITKGISGNTLDLDASPTLTMTVVGDPSGFTLPAANTPLYKEATGIYSYDWTLLYSYPAGVIEVTIDALYKSKPYIEKAVVELYKSGEFNPVRITSGVVV